MALGDPDDPYGIYAPAWDEERDRAMLAALFPQPVEAAPPAAPETSTQQLGPAFGGPTVAEEVAQAPQQEQPAGLELPPYAVAPGKPKITLPFEADAVSDAGAKPPTGTQIGAAPMPTDRPIEEIQDPVEQAKAWEHLADTKPELYGEAMQRHAIDEMERRQAGAEAIARQEIEQKRQIRERLDQINARREKLIVENEVAVTELAKTKIDPDRWWSSQSTGQKIFNVLSVVVGGLVQGQVGGSNIGLDIINQAIERDIEAQKANLANKGDLIGKRQGIVAQLVAQGVDVERAGDIAIQAAKEQSLQQLEQEMVKYDPKGKIARDLAQQIMKGRAQLAADAQKRADTQLDREIKAGDYGLRVREQQRKERKDAADAQLRAAAAGKTKADKIPLPPSHYAQKYGHAVPAELLPKTPMTESEFKNYLETTDKGRAVASKLDARRIVGVMPDGGDLIARAGGDEEVAKVRDQVTASKGMVRLIDEARRIRTGWTSDTAKSKEWQELKTIWANAKGKGKNALGLGAMSDSDFEFLGQYLGTDDPTKGRGVEHAIVKARQLIISDANDALKSVGYTGKYDIKDLQARGPVSSNEDQELERVLGSPSGEARAQAAGNMARIPAAADQIALVNKWAGIAATATNDEDRQRAMDRLGSAAAKARTPQVRKLAQQVLTRFATPSAPTEEAGGPRGEVTHETIPEAAE